MFTSYISKHWRRNSDRERVASTREMFLIVVEALEHMEDHMTEITDALATESGAIASLGTSLTNTLNDLQAEVSNLQSNPQIPAGVLDAVNAHVASLQSIAAQVSAADPGPAPSPTSPGTGSDDGSTPAPTDPSAGTDVPITPTPVDTPAPVVDPAPGAPTDPSADLPTGLPEGDGTVAAPGDAAPTTA